MRLFGLNHIFWLFVIASTSASLALLCRRTTRFNTLVRAALVILLVGGELQRYFQDGVAYPTKLPFHLCNVTTWFAILACLTLTPRAVEFVYFSGLAAAGMTMLTPDMGAVWPVRFYVNHGALIVTACVLVFGRLSPLRSGAVWRAFGCFLAYAACAGTFDWLSGANYGYLRRKPSGVSIISFLGPWPIYIFGLALVALGLFALLYLPARESTRLAKSPSVSGLEDDTSAAIPLPPSPQST